MQHSIAAEGTNLAPHDFRTLLELADRYPQTIYPSKDFREVVIAQYSVTGKVFE